MWRRYPTWCVCFQRITGSTLGRDLRMFGQSLSSGIDIDDNGYQGNPNYHYSCFHITVLCISVLITSALHKAKLSLSLQMWRLVRSSRTRLWFSGKTTLKL